MILKDWGCLFKFFIGVICFMCFVCFVLEGGYVTDRIVAKQQYFCNRSVFVSYKSKEQGLNLSGS